MTSFAPDLLAEKIAVVIGGGRGLGRAVAIGLVRHGAQVAVAARSADQLAETAAAIEAVGGKFFTLAVDATDPAAVTRLRLSAQEALGPPTILVNAAGVFGPIQPVVDSDVDRWIETVRVNAIAPYLACRAFVPDMLAAGWGRIINFSSAASLHPPGPLNSAYGTSKVALNQFTRHLAAELAGTGVTANVIHPGEVKTAMWAAINEESAAAPGAEAYRGWAAAVGESGGDDPQLAVDLVLQIIAGRHASESGKFLWIEGGQQSPIPSW